MQMSDNGITTLFGNFKKKQKNIFLQHKFFISLYGTYFLVQSVSKRPGPEDEMGEIY